MDENILILKAYEIFSNVKYFVKFDCTLNLYFDKWFDKYDVTLGYLQESVNFELYRYF